MRSPNHFALALAAALLVTAACDRAQPDAQAAPPAEQAAPVDSATSMSEELRRFREGIPQTSALGDGAATERDSLVARYVRALEARDTAAFRAMAMDRAEFAYLYYETSPQANPPYELPADVVWFQIVGNNEKGAGRALQRYGGRGLGYQGYTCARQETQGENTIWSDCALRLRAEGVPPEMVLFGAIVERGGRYKFVSYENDL